RRRRMGDEEADLTDHFLHGAVSVIEERAFLIHGEFIGVFFARCDRLLADEGSAVLVDGNFEAVPVDRSGFRKAIFEDDPDAIGLIDLNGGSRAGTVVAPGIDGLEWRDFAANGFRSEVKDFYVAVEFVREIGDVGSKHGWAGRG